MKLFNTLTRKKELFVPIVDDNVGLYTCGPTVYNYAHIGNLRTYIFEDLLKRALKYKGYNVKHVMNVTDVGHLVSDEDTGEDKMEVGAKRENKTAWEIAEFYYQAFRNDMAKLNIEEPDIWCKATDHISEQIELIKKLEEKGYTYIIEDGVYFDTSKDKNYGRLAKLDIEGLKAGARIELAEGKRNITDFALWKFSPKDKKRQMEWNSPWGVGFPGWHIECSAMAMKYLGEHIDIHCGGIDHIPVHHTNEIAQSECAIGGKWVNVWMHGEFLVVGKNEKMAKSGENFLTVQVLTDKGLDPLAYRYFCCNAHYRKQLVFTWEGLESANNGLHRLKNKVKEFKAYSEVNGIGRINNKYMDEFIKNMEDDLNVPLALASAWDLANDNKIPQNDRYATLVEMDKMLGLNLDKAEESLILEDEIMKKIEERQTARTNKDWAKADQIRNELLQKGIVLEDTSQGVRWKREH